MPIKVSSAVALLVVVLAPGLLAQGRAGGAPAGPAPTGRGAAPQDLTGTWVSVVTQHWHFRMQVPPKNDFTMLPVNAEARRVAATWDMAKEAAGSDQCKGYGAGIIMRIPGRVDIRWVDDNTLKLDFDSGGQSRLIHVGGAPPAAPPAPSLQGYSVANWEGIARGRGAPAGVFGAAGMLRVNTTRMSGGLLRKNGVPYSANATLVEYLDSFTEPNGDKWLNVTTVLTDPTYLTGPYVTTNSFKKIPDRQGWDPTPCRADEPR